MGPVGGTGHIRQLFERIGKIAQISRKSRKRHKAQYSGKRHNEQAMLLVHMAVLLFLYSIPDRVETPLRCFARKSNALTDHARMARFFPLQNKLVSFGKL